MKVLEKISIGNLELKNRYVMVAMGPELGDFDPKTIEYYVKRAQGGAAMIMINAVATREIDGPTPSSLIDETTFDGLKTLVDRCHEYDCKVCIQIMPGTGLMTKAEGREKPSAPSALPFYPGSDMSYQALTLEEIKFLQDKVASALILAKKAGVDAVEIHAYGGYLTDKFMSKIWNKREDHYGGSLENRLRFLTEIIDNTKRDLGEDFPLLVKFTPTHNLPTDFGYRGIEEGLEIAKYLEDKGVHALHVDVGCHDNWYMAMPPIYQQEMVPQMDASRLVKEVVDVPVLSNGRLGDIGKAETALENLWIDLVGVGRGFLADPDFPNKVKDNRADEIRYCIYCNEGCINSVAQGRQIDCAVNPLAGFETTKSLTKTKDPKKILVIGAGPGGCQAALSAKEAGHEVEVWEKEARLGGNFYLACQPPFKKDGDKILGYYENQLNKLGITVKYNKKAQAQDILDHGPDLVINASGASPLRPGAIKGIGKAHVTTASQVLEKRAILGEKIVIIGAGLVGVETALTLKQKGKDVTLVEMMDQVLPEPIFIQNLMMLNQLLEASQIVAHTSTKLEEIKDKSIIVSQDEETREIDCDSVVLAMGFKPENSFLEELEGKLPLVSIGDSLGARKVIDATREAHEAILNLG